MKKLLLFVLFVAIFLIGFNLFSYNYMQKQLSRPGGIEKEVTNVITIQVFDEGERLVKDIKEMEHVQRVKVKNRAELLNKFKNKFEKQMGEKDKGFAEDTFTVDNFPTIITVTLDDKKYTNEFVDELKKKGLSESHIFYEEYKIRK